jgi:glycosyltransferase involved in cell wall biosynthesis
MTRKKILFIIPSLKAGGAERITAFLAQHTSSEQFETILIIVGFKEDCVYDFDDSKTLFLKKSRYLKSIPILIRIIKKEKPHLIFSSSGHINITMGFLSAFFSKIKFIIRETNIVSVVNGFSKEKNTIMYLSMKIFYPFLNGIVCQSQDMKTDLIDKLSINSSKITVINNPIIDTIPNKIKGKETQNIRFITVGRMSWIKGHLRILKVLSQLKYDFKYTIIGSGLTKETNIIHEEVKRLKLENKVSNITYSNTILEEIQQHDIFLQGSYVEGFPNVLLESCSVGTPVIAFDVPGGTKEIIQNGINGFLVKDETELYSLLNNIELVQKLKRESIIESVIKKFNKDHILRQYENLFSTLLQ